MNLKIFRPNEYDIELNLLTRVVGLESLHHGYWLDGEELTLENLKQAQARYTNKLLEYVPDGTKDVLDVGAGIGDNAKTFANSGYNVTAISPEPTQNTIFQEIMKEYPNIRFEQSRYEDYDTDIRYDLILMSESSNYFDLKSGMERTSTLLKPGGYLLISSIFSRDTNLRGELDESHRYARNDFMKAAERVGLKVVKSEEITDATLPTLELAHSYYLEYFEPTVHVLTEWYENAFMLKTKLLKLFFKKEMSLGRNLVEKIISERINPELFKEKYTYELVLFKM